MALTKKEALDGALRRMAVIVEVAKLLKHDFPHDTAKELLSKGRDLVDEGLKIRLEEEGLI